MRPHPRRSPRRCGRLGEVTEVIDALGSILAVSSAALFSVEALDAMGAPIWFCVCAASAVTVYIALLCEG